MKATKNTILKYSNYTTALTRNLKVTERLHCRVDEENKAVYVCNGYFLVKLNPAEYDALVRPITQRDAGNYILNSDGSTSPDPLDMENLLTDTAREAVHGLTPAPFLFDPGSKNTKAKIAAYYSKDGDFVAGFNADYISIISAGLPRKSKNPVSPMVIFNGDEPQAIILPVRLGSDDKPSRVPAAVRAFFTDKPEALGGEAAPALSRAQRGPREDAGEKLKRARKDRDEWESMARRLEAERDSRERELSELQAVLASKNEQIETLTARLNAQQDAKPTPALGGEAAPALSRAQRGPRVEDAPQKQSPADKAAALVEKLASLDGITATVKGAQTAAPVVWLAGEADAHKEKIEAMGGKWSVKRSAWYFKVA